MGGEQAFQWALSHPGFADRIVVTSATAKAWPQGIVRPESPIMAIQNDPDLRRDPGRLAILTGLVARRVVARRLAPGTTFRSVVEGLYEDFVPGGDVKRALASITVPVLYMPSATDLCFPVDDARYEQDSCRTSR